MPRTSTAYAVPPKPHSAPLAARDTVIRRLADGGGLWPLLPWNPCTLCALPRRARTGHPLCDRCRWLRWRYGTALLELRPAALTARDWALATALRAFKDVERADPASPNAQAFAAILSTLLDDVLRTSTADRITAVPTSRPVIAAALTRARREGWPVPDLTPVAAVREGHPGQRKRPFPQRLQIDGKWDVEPAAVRGRDLLVLDDVATTGATLHSFAAALREAGAARVRAVVLARHVGPDAHWLLPLLQERQALGVRWRRGTPDAGSAA